MNIKMISIMINLMTNMIHIMMNNNDEYHDY